MQVKYGSENLSAWRRTRSLIGASCLFGQSHASDGWKSESLRRVEHANKKMTRMWWGRNKERHVTWHAEFYQGYLLMIYGSCVRRHVAFRTFVIYITSKRYCCWSTPRGPLWYYLLPLLLQFIYDLYIRVITLLNLTIIMAPLLIDNSIFWCWVHNVRGKAQTPNTSSHHRTLVVER